MRPSPNTMEKVQKHLAEAARLLGSQMLLAADWAMDIEAAAYSIKSEHNEAVQWSKKNCEKIQKISNIIKDLSAKHEISLEPLEIESVIEFIIIEGDDLLADSERLEKEILHQMQYEIEGRNKKIFS